jgi:hypothetical protein
MFAIPPLESLAARVRLDVREMTRIGEDFRLIARIVPPETGDAQSATVPAQLADAAR